MKRIARVLVCALCSCALLLVGAVSAFADTPIVVSMGDSFACGEGVEPFYNQSSVYKYWDQDWIAHRSEQAWPGLLRVEGTLLSSAKATPSNATAVQKGDTITYYLDDWSEGTWFFVAASEARVRHMVGSANNSSNYLERVINASNRTVGKVDYTALLEPQIEVFDYINETYGENSVDYVTISLGGNEIGFADIIIKAALNSSLIGTNNLRTRIEESKTEFERSYKNEIKQGLWAVRDAAGTQAKILVVGYPTIFDGAKSTLLFGQKEYTLMNDMALWLDVQLATLVAELNADGYDNLYYVSVIDAFKGHGAYSNDPYINGVVLGAQDEDLAPSGTNTIVSFYSIHPNAKGSQVYAAAVQKVIDELEASGSGDTPHAPGWAYEDGAYYFYENDGSMRKSSWASYYGSWYYLGWDGKLVINGWSYYNGSYYYMGSNGQVLTNGWVHYGDYYYYMGADGKPVVNNWVQYGDSWYYFDATGKCTRVWSPAA